MDDQPPIILKLTAREAAVIRKLSCFFAWNGGDFGPEMRSVYTALSDCSILNQIDHIHPCVRYRDTNKLMPTDGLIIDDLGMKGFKIRRIK